MKIFILSALMVLVGCQEQKSSSATPGRPQAEVNAAVMKVLEQHAPEVVAMEHGLDQAIAVMDKLNNATRIYNDPRQGLLQPEDLLEAVFTDPEMGLICGGFALVIYDSLTALGYETRMVQMFSNGPDNHIANEVKVDGKWYALDGTFNIVFKNTNGDVLSYREMKDQVNNGEGIGAEYVGNTILSLDDYYMPYEPYLANVRALPTWARNQAALSQSFNGEERF